MSPPSPPRHTLSAVLHLAHVKSSSALSLAMLQPLPSLELSLNLARVSPLCFLCHFLQMFCFSADFLFLPPFFLLVCFVMTPSNEDVAYISWGVCSGMPSHGILNVCLGSSERLPEASTCTSVYCFPLLDLGSALCICTVFIARHCLAVGLGKTINKWYALRRGLRKQPRQAKEATIASRRETN